jgi:exopolysaccharide biosynthesis WecB/TagA/CpsF family protein
MRQAYYNLALDILSEEQSLERIEGLYQGKGTGTVFFVNSHCFNISQQDKEYKNALLNSELILNDGIGIKIGAKLIGLDLIENLNGTDLIPKIIQQACRLKKNIYLLGGKEGIAAEASKKLKLRFPDINISGTRSGYFSIEDEPGIIKELDGTDLLILGMGVPKQEVWAFTNKNKLKDVKLIIAGGAILDFISGNVNRAPEWLRKLNLEWLYRLLIEPGRLWKRYLIGNIKFFYYLFRFKRKG